MRFLSRTVAIAAVIACGAVSTASAQHFDVLTTSLSGKLINGGYDDGNNLSIAPLRIFEGEVISDGVPGVSPSTGAPYLAEAPGDPGFRAISQADLNDPTKMTPSAVYTALPASTGFFFDFLPITIGADTRNLFYWDGTGPVDFAPVASSYELTLNKFGGGGFAVTTDGDDAALVMGNNIQTTTALGQIHAHLFAELDVDSGGALDPASGFYLFSLQFRMTGLTTSDPAYFVYGAVDPGSFLTGEALDEFLEDEFEPAHELAVEWVNENLVAIPEPSSAVLVTGGVAVLGFMRRRRACG